MRRCWLALAFLLLLAHFHAAGRAAQPPEKKTGSKTAGAAGNVVLVVVNGRKVTESDLDRWLLTRKVSDEQRLAERDRFIEQLIDARLMQQFLEARDTKATKQELDEQVNRIRNAAKKRGADPDKVLAELGYTPQSLRDEFALPIAWRHHVDRAVPAARLKAYFDAHHPEFDGTTVRARRILVKPADGTNEAWQAAETKLAALRQQIADGRLTFEQAARDHSQAPSRAQGGDVGEFPFSGKMPAQFSRAAFGLQDGEISRPFRTRYGMELCQVIERKPGDLSLEDVRDDVLARLSQELWNETIADLRKTATIEWKVERQAARPAD